MTELMLNLARKAGARADFSITGVEDPDFLVADIYDLELFAQLIVEECCDFLKDTLDDQFAAEQLAEHFEFDN